MNSSSTSQKTRCIYITKTARLISFRTLIAVYCEYRNKTHNYTLGVNVCSLVHQVRHRIVITLAGVVFPFKVKQYVCKDDLF